MDGGYIDYEDIAKVQQGKKGCKVYSPVPASSRKEGRLLCSENQGQPPGGGVAAADGDRKKRKEIYKQRGATAEWVNAQARNHGLQQLLVRGKNKVRAIGLWFAAALNMAHGFFLQSQLVNSSALSPSGP